MEKTFGNNELISNTGIEYTLGQIPDAEITKLGNGEYRISQTDTRGVILTTDVYRNPAIKRLHNRRLIIREMQAICPESNQNVDLLSLYPNETTVFYDPQAYYNGHYIDGSIVVGPMYYQEGDPRYNYEKISAETHLATLLTEAAHAHQSAGEDKTDFLKQDVVLKRRQLFLDSLLYFSHNVTRLPKTLFNFDKLVDIYNYNSKLERDATACGFMFYRNILRSQGINIFPGLNPQEVFKLFYQDLHDYSTRWPLFVHTQNETKVRLLGATEDELGDNKSKYGHSQIIKHFVSASQASKV